MADMNRWQPVQIPQDVGPPTPMTVRVQTLAPRSFFPEHEHGWAQLVYAITGVLTVAIQSRSFAISPEQAVWLPEGERHRVGSLHGAEFRSLWVATDATRGLPEAPVVFAVGPLLRALIVEAAELQTRPDDDREYAERIVALILDQLSRAAPLPVALPWPQSDALRQLCEALYADPCDPRPAEAWAREIGMSPRTLTRRFEAELGISLRSWRRRLRLFKAIEMLGGGSDVTGAALDLGYASTSAFVYAFRTGMGSTPQAYMRSNDLRGR